MMSLSDMISMRLEHVEFVLLSRKSDTNDGRICRNGDSMIYNM